MNQAQTLFTIIVVSLLTKVGVSLEFSPQRI